MSSGTTLFFGLFNNLAIFIVLIAAYSALNGWLEKWGRDVRSVALGIVFGAFAIAGMHVTIPVADGIIVDQRYAIIVLSGAFGGPMSGWISALMAGSYRLVLGGYGTFAGVMGIFLAAIVGAIGYAFREKVDTIPKAALAALLATATNFLGYLFLGDVETVVGVMRETALPYGSAIFLGIFLVGILLAIGESRQTALGELNLSEKRYRELFETLIDVSYRTDRNGIIEMMSPSSLQVFGYSPEEVIGRPMSDFYRHPTTRQDLMERLRRDGRIDNFETEIRTRSGETVWVSTNAKLLKDENGASLGVQGLTRDISQQKRSEEQKAAMEARLQHGQKMEAIGTLAGGIAHDFNNILGAVMGYSELALEEIPEDAKEREYLKAVLSAATRAKDLTQQILTFSRKGRADKALVKLEPVVQEALKLLRNTIPATVEINTSLDPSTGFVLADSTQIHQIIVNLGTNAYHSLDGEMGEIEVRLRSVEVDGSTDARHHGLRAGPYACLTVRDTGRGMDEEALHRIFEPFFTTKEVGRGTGLGLAVVHGIVQDHGGSITVRSEPNVGSTFEVFLPSSSEEGEVQSEAPAEPRMGTESILFVDDDPALVRLGKEVLEKSGYRVVPRQSALEALNSFKEDPGAFDLIVTDQTMPEMPGDKLAAEAIRLRPDIPVIICTGHSAVLDREKARSLGARAFLMKPLDNRELSEAVAAIFEEEEK